MTGKDLKDMVDKAQMGDNDAMYKIILEYDGLIEARSKGDEDCKSYIIINLIQAIKKFRFKN